MRRNKNKMVRGLILTAILAGASGGSGAEPIEIKGEDTLASLLAAVKGKNVEVQTTSGEKLTGTVKFVGEHTLLLARLRSREFYDAYIALDRISAFVISNQ